MNDSLIHLSSALAPPLFAGIGKYLTGLTTRQGIIQMCVICMCLALFIIMKKFSSEKWSVVSGQWSVKKTTPTTNAAEPPGTSPSSLTTDH